VDVKLLVFRDSTAIWCGRKASTFRGDILSQSSFYRN